MRMRILAVLPFPEDRAILRSVFTLPTWEVHFTRTFEEARQKLRDGGVGVILSECRLADGHSWKDLLDEIQTIANPPPLIVTDRLADECLWAEVLNLGGYDLLMKPFDRTEVLRVVSVACLAWERQRGQSGRPKQQPSTEGRRPADKGRAYGA